MIEVALAGGIGEGQGNQEGEGACAFHAACVQCRHTSLGAHLATNQEPFRDQARSALGSVCDLTMDSAFVAPERYVKLMVYLCRRLDSFRGKS